MHCGAQGGARRACVALAVYYLYTWRRRRYRSLHPHSTAPGKARLATICLAASSAGQQPADAVLSTACQWGYSGDRSQCHFLWQQSDSGHSLGLSGSGQGKGRLTTQGTGRTGTAVVLPWHRTGPVHVQVQAF